MRGHILLLVTACVLQAHVAAAQVLTGALIGTVKDVQGGVLQGAVVRVSSPALIGAPETTTTNEKGQLRIPALPPGLYVLDVEVKGFKTYHEEGIRIGVGATIERTAVLNVGIEESLVVEGAGSRIEARGSGFETRFGPEDLRAIPCDDSACSTSSGPRLACHPPRQAVSRPTASLRSVPVLTRTRFSSTVRTSPVLAVERRDPSPGWTLFRKCKSSRSERPPSSATCKGRGQHHHPAGE